MSIQTKSMAETIVKLKKEIKSKKEEIGYLNDMLSDAD